MLPSWHSAFLKDDVDSDVAVVRPRGDVGSVVYGTGYVEMLLGGGGGGGRTLRAGDRTEIGSG